MVAVVVIAVGAIEVTLTHAIYDEGRLCHVEALALAEGGVDAGYQKLADDPDYRGTFTITATNGESCDISIADVGANVEMRATASIGTLTREFLVEFQTVVVEGEGGSSLDYPLASSGNIEISNGFLDVSPETVLAGSVVIGPAGSMVGPTVEESVGTVSIDESSIEDRATATTSGNRWIGPGGIHDFGVTVHSGTLSIEGPVTLIGTVLVRGNLMVKGFGNPVVLGTVADPLQAFVTGDTSITQAGSSSLAGLFVTLGSFHVTQSIGVTGRGGIFLNGLFKVAQANFTFELDSSVVGDASPISGISTFGGSMTYTETRRRVIAR